MVFEGISLPSDLLDKEQFMAMSHAEKETYIEKVLEEILKLNPNGVITSAVAKATGFNKVTVWHHLEKKSSTREGYKLQFGKTVVYYPNGKMVHHAKNEDIKVGDKTYSFYFVKNNFGNFIYLQEKKTDRLGITDVCGGLLLPAETLNAFIESLKNVENNLKKYEKLEVEQNV